MTYGQLIECNVRNIFLEKPDIKCGGETSPQTLFWKIKIVHISDSTVQSFTQFVFIVWQIEGYWNTLKLTCRPLDFNSN